MSKIDEMIKELCPEGVEMVTLGSLGKFENIGVDKKSIENEQDVVLLNYTDVYHHKYINSSIPSMIVTASDKKRLACNVLKGDIFVTPTSETVDDIGHSSVITEDINNCVYSYHIMRYRLDTHNMVTSFYINYMFDLNIVKQQILKKAQGLTRFGLSKDKFASIEIPLPPLSIQQEIVSVLDSFTTLIDKMKQEVEKRKKQMEYYREKLLTFEEAERALSYYAFQPKERIEASELDQDNYVSVENLLKDKLGKTVSESVPTEGNWIKYEVGDILIGNIRPYLKKIWLADRSGGTNGDVIVLRRNKNNEVDCKYLYYVLSSDKFFIFYNNTAKGGKMPRGDKNRLMDYPVYFPSLAKQSSIVSTLDKFESYITKLEKMITLRQKQYECYREQLLTFRPSPTLP